MDETAIGVLALQGAFREHLEMLDGLGVKGREVRRPEELRGLNGLIIPGGESTTIGKLAVDWQLLPTLSELIGGGLPTWGTCAGMILLAKEIGRRQPLIGVMDVVVARNAFGRQVDSFEVDLPIPALATNGDNPPFRAVFIRAPLIERVGPGVKILARLEDGTIVAARQNNLLATSFHPELTKDSRFHRYFLDVVRSASS